MTKKRVLCVSEAHFLSTGYSVYTNELLRRLFNTGKYELAELSCYCEINDRRINAPWIIYPNLPDKNSPNNVAAYESDVKNEFGKWLFNPVVLDFQPDIIFSIRDIWMDEHICNSELRSLYKWAWMAPVDSAPQDDAWLEQFIDADAVFYYTDWGKEVLNNQANKKVNSKVRVPPAAESVFKPINNKEEHKKKLGLGPNPFIIGSTMRNQKRKLFPDLIESFRLFLDKCKECGNDDLYNRSYLYLHTTYPDIGWEIPELLKEHGVANKTLFTYRCTDCGYSSVSFYQGNRLFCPKCQHYSFSFPNTNLGITRQSLAEIYNLFDVYVQYSIAEGLSIPLVEASQCGVHVMAVNYSGMEDIIKYCAGTPINVQRRFREAETNAYRVYPDNRDFVEKLYKFANMPASLRQRKGFETYKAVTKNYSWDKTAKVWEDYFDTQDISRKSINPLLPLNQNIPNNLPNNEFLKFVYTHILGKPNLINGFSYLKRLKWLNYGARIDNRGGLLLPDESNIGGKTFWREYGRKECIEEMLVARQNYEYWYNAALAGINRQNSNLPQIAFATNRKVINNKVYNKNQ